MIINRSRILLFIVFISLKGFGCLDLYAQQIGEVNLTKYSTITGDQKYFLGSPEDLLVDDEQIYIADLIDMKIKVFSREGEYIREMGGRGRGPGEFLHLTAVWLNSSGDFYVADYTNAKVAVFNSSGSLIDERKIGSGNMMWPRVFHEVNSREYLVLYTTRRAPEELFHFWDSGFNSWKSSFSLHPDVIGNDVLKEVTLGVRVGNSLVRDSVLYYAPFFYEGNIYSKHLYNEENWTVHPGKSTSTNSYEMMRPGQQLRNKDGQNIHDYRINSPEGTFVYRLNNRSLALFTTKEGYLAHFIEIRQGNRKEQGIELYDAEGTFLLYRSYYSEEIREDRYTLIPEVPKAIDGNNRVYTIDWRGEMPVVNIYQLDIR